MWMLKKIKNQRKEKMDTRSMHVPGSESSDLNSGEQN